MVALNFIWNSNEVLASFDLPIVGIFQLRYYSLMFIVAFSLGWYLSKKIYLNEGKTVQQLDTLFVYTAIATLVGARLGDCFFYNWDYFKDHLLEIFLPIKEKAGGGWQLTGFSGLASHGAAVGIIIAMLLYVRKYKDIKLSWILDRVVIPITIGGMFVRFGNFFNSEINGKIVSDQYPLGVKFVQNGMLSPHRAMALTEQTDAQEAYKLITNDPRYAEVLASIPYQHPAQLYEAFGYFCLFWVLWYVYWKTDKKEQPYFIFGLFLVLLWSIRFAVEFVKESQGGFESTLGLLSTGQWLSVPFIIVGLYLLFRKKSQNFNV
ncbi:prolipoprotein diacylglyceryl transferase [Capnocytophaga leadbetteri]|uniref:prolipoprotein diacylglyceryl transferase n=1 Tax=Capnocytophaga leadbetteri TaxID=327575 RepID=UPI0028D7AC05|nr:prolipoprotein diacylglyceryl transferase [Capnocytophaga leadbetteri]